MKISKELLGFLIGAVLLAAWSFSLVQNCPDEWFRHCEDTFSPFSLPVLLLMEMLSIASVGISAALLIAYHFLIGGMIGTLFTIYIVARKPIDLEKKLAVKLVTLYAFVSWTLFVSTTGGWTMIALLPGYTIIFFILWLAFLCMSLVRQKTLRVSQQKTVLLLGIQLLALLFNLGDGGDSYGIIVFIQRFFGSTETFDTLNLFGGAVIIGYFIVLFFTLFPDALKIFQRSGSGR